MQRFINRPRQLPQVSATTTTTTTAASATPSPLNIPEILERVFSFLDCFWIRRSAVFVCRRWRLLNHHRVVREVTWFEDWKPLRKERALSKLPGAGRLSVYYPGSCVYEYNQDIVNLLKLLELDYQEQLNKDRISIGTADDNSSSGRYSIISGTKGYASKLQLTFTSTPTIYDFTPLRELYLTAEDCDFNSFPFPSSLTTLTIHVGSTIYRKYFLYNVLRKCPLLEHLSLESASVDGLFVLADSLDPTIVRLPLRSLTFFNVTLVPLVLDRLLPLTPDLKELKLMSMSWDYNTLFDWIRLYAALRANNITLDKAHFSMHENKMTAEEAGQFWRDVYPQMSPSELSLWTLDITPPLLATLFSQPGTLTTLDILWKPSRTRVSKDHYHPSLKDINKLVHHYLCNSPFLVHLKTLKTVVLLEDLDLFQRRGHIDLDNQQDTTQQAKPQDPPSSLLRRVWRCRGLQTLHIDIYGQVGDPVHSRIVYGYISRVCPRLEDLLISSPFLSESSSRVGATHSDTSPSLQLAGGLCLLGRLKYLRRLAVVRNERIEASTCKEWDLNWIVASGRQSIQSRKRRRQEMKGWKESRKTNGQLEATRARIRLEHQLGTWHGSSGTEEGSKDDGAVVLIQLEHLGLLVEVEKMMSEIDADNESVQPFPTLQQLSLIDPILLHPEEELERLFPRKNKTWRSLWTK